MAVSTLRSNTTNSTIIAQSLSVYISSISNLPGSPNTAYSLSPHEIDNFVGNLNLNNLIINTNDSFLMAQQPSQTVNNFVLGASFQSGVGGQVVNTLNEDSVLSSQISTAAIVDSNVITYIKNLNMFIIDKPKDFQNINNTNNKTLASSVVIVNAERYPNASSIITPISLYFRVSNGSQPNVSADYLCSFYDASGSNWNESGCGAAIYNSVFDRYECSCNHFTSFALIWLPKGTLTTYLDAQDIGSLVCLSISIVCFLAIIIYTLTRRICDPKTSLKPYELLPLISSASTTILFIFYIALGMTVYTKTSSVNQSQCFLSSSVLMFFVYFFLIFMFCTKTSVGYFNYLRFICLFPQPSIRRLVTLLVISFLISITWVAFAAGFNSNPSFKIIQLYPYKLCWFNRDVLYYFLTIPASIFLLVNIIIFILVAIRIINHARNATSPHHSFDRMKRCVLVLLSSCATQGIGWLFGPFLTFIDAKSGNILGWFFIIFNGLEGLWSIILYLIIRSKKMDESKQTTAIKEYTKARESKFGKDKKPSIRLDRNESDLRIRDNELHYRNARKEVPRISDYTDEVEEITWPMDDDGMQMRTEI